MIRSIYIFPNPSCTCFSVPIYKSRIHISFFCGIDRYLAPQKQNNRTILTTQNKNKNKFNSHPIILSKNWAYIHKDRASDQARDHWHIFLSWSNHGHTYLLDSTMSPSKTCWWTAIWLLLTAGYIIKSIDFNPLYSLSDLEKRVADKCALNHGKVKYPTTV